MGNNGKRFLGTQVDESFHKEVKLRCIERDITIQKAIMLGLGLYLGIEPPEECNVKLVSEGG